MPPKPHFLLLLVLFFFGFHCYAQNDLLDYVVKDNDTLYGAIRANGTNKRLWFYQRIKRDNGSTFIKEEKLKKKNIKTFRRNGKVYHYRDKDYQTKIPVIPTYIVTTEGDTIYGEINTTLFMNKKYLLDDEENKYPVNPELVPSYSVDNKIYRLVDGSYSRLILEGPVSLYYFYQANTGGGMTMDFKADLSGVYIKKEREFQRVYNSGFLLVTRELFGDNLELMERIENKEFTYENIYLVTKIYNRYLENRGASFQLN